MAVINVRCTESEKNAIDFLAEKKRIPVSELLRRKLMTFYDVSKTEDFRCPDLHEDYFANEKKTENLHSRVPDYVWYWINMIANCNNISVTSLIRYVIIHM